MPPGSAPYLEVAADLQRRLDEGEWGVGRRIDSRSELAAHYGVGVNVIQRAVERLIADGRLEGVAGVGVFVRPHRQRRRIVRPLHRARAGVAPFQADMHELGVHGAWEAHTAVRVPAPEDIAERLAIDEGAWTVRTDYEYLGDGEPVQIAQSWEPMAITGGTPIVLPESGPLAGAGVIARMQSIGVIVARVTEVPRPARASQRAANLLGLPRGDLVLLIERTYLDEHGRPVATEDITMPAARWETAYEIEVPRPPR